MKKLITGLAVAVLSLWIAGTAQGAASDHDVTVTVQDINHIIVAGGDVTLTIDTATAGQDPDAVQDNTTKLHWTVNSSTSKKVTATLDSDYSAGITLNVQVTVSGGNGSSQGQQTLSASGVTLVTGIHGEATANNTLAYEASVTAAVAPTTETRTVTYTLVDE